MTELDVIEKVTTKIKKPKNWVIMLHNDDVTTMDFVVELLASVFGFDYARSTELMMKVHLTGQAIVGTYTFQIAEQKYEEAMHFIKSYGQTLKISMSEES